MWAAIRPRPRPSRSIKARRAAAWSWRKERGGPVEMNETVSLTFPVNGPGRQAVLLRPGHHKRRQCQHRQRPVSLTSASRPRRTWSLSDPGVWTPDALEIALDAIEGERAGRLSHPARNVGRNGPFELVGESAVPGFTDTLAERGQDYCYAAQAHNNGTLSLGQAVCGSVGRCCTLIFPVMCDAEVHRTSIHITETLHEDPIDICSQPLVLRPDRTYCWVASSRSTLC